MKKYPSAVETAITAYKQVQSVLPFGASNIKTNPYYGSNTLMMRIQLSRVIARRLLPKCISITASPEGTFHQYILLSAIIAEAYQAGNCEEQSAVGAFWLLSKGNVDAITLVRQQVDDHVYLAYTQDNLSIQLDSWKTYIKYTDDAGKKYGLLLNKKNQSFTEEEASLGSLKKENRVISQETIFQYGDALSTFFTELKKTIDSNWPLISAQTEKEFKPLHENQPDKLHSIVKKYHTFILSILSAKSINLFSISLFSVMTTHHKKTKDSTENVIRLANKETTKFISEYRKTKGSFRYLLQTSNPSDSSFVRSLKRQSQLVDGVSSERIIFSIYQGLKKATQSFQDNYPVSKKPRLATNH